MQLTLALPSALVLLTGLAGAQSFQNNLTDIPTGGAANNSFTENMAFADVDADGDLDVVFADGGDLGNDRNRLWVNQGGLQAGTVGVSGSSLISSGSPMVTINVPNENA